MDYGIVTDYDEITKYAAAGPTHKKHVSDLGSFMNPDVTKIAPDLNLLQGKWEVDFIFLSLEDT